MRKDVWHNRRSVFGGGHLKRPIYRSPAAAFFPMRRTMKKLNKVATLFAVATVAGSAFAAGSTINSDNWRSGHGALQAPAATPTPPAVAPVPPAPPAPVAAQKVTYAADAFFDFDKSVLKPEGRAKLDDLVGKIQGINLEVIIAVGHTDSIGSDAYNQRLSVRRAEAVKAYLVSKGIERNRIYTEGKGKKQPIASNATAEGRAKNRRVEVEVVGTRASQ